VNHSAVGALFLTLAMSPPAASAESRPKPLQFQQVELMPGISLGLPTDWDGNAKVTAGTYQQALCHLPANAVFLFGMDHKPMLSISVGTSTEQPMPLADWLALSAADLEALRAQAETRMAEAMSRSDSLTLFPPMNLEKVTVDGRPAVLMAYRVGFNDTPDWSDRVVKRYEIPDRGTPEGDRMVYLCFDYPVNDARDSHELSQQITESVVIGRPHDRPN